MPSSFVVTCSSLGGNTQRINLNSILFRTLKPLKICYFTVSGTSQRTRAALVAHFLYFPKIIKPYKINFKLKPQLYLLVLNCVFIGPFLGGAQTKRPRVNIRDMSAKEGDPEAVATIFAMTSFDGENWIQTLPKDKIAAYKVAMEGTRIIDRQISYTMDFLPEYSNLKDL